ncbi:hypothetical protein RB601_007976 [Gaeumannomyces tritici]
MDRRSLPLLALFAFSWAGTAERCKSIPGDATWPADYAWRTLNETVGGRLTATVPAASVCHTGGVFDGRFNATACQWLKTFWNFPIAHFPFPAEVGFPWVQNGSCDPYMPVTQPCELGNYASYSINVTREEDVVAGIRFARENDVRLSIKNTGHDYLGKSTGKGSLSLWTQNLKAIEVMDNYSSPYYTGPAIKLGAGVLAVEAYLAAHERGYRVVGGTCATVGVAGGYSQGGGHSTLSSAYGLAADNVLAWEAVLPATGERVVATPDGPHADLYWALSGGGGGTFAVVLGMTARLHRDGPVGGATLWFDDSGILDGDSINGDRNSSNSSSSSSRNDVFWDAVGAVHAALPPLLARGVSALYSITDRTFNLFSLTAADRDGAQVAALLRATLLPELERRGVPFAFEAHQSPGFLAHFARDLGPLPYGLFSTGQVTGSRLIPRAVVGGPAVTGALRNVTAAAAAGDFFVACQALDVSGGGDSFLPRVADNAVLPAWRDAATHCIVVGPWDYGGGGDAEGLAVARARMEAKQRQLADVFTPMLEAATPGSGTYLNEANFQQRKFQEHFYGANYERLLRVKRKYDPEGILYAVTGVGSEMFEEDAEGRLCRTVEER